MNVGSLPINLGPAKLHCLIHPKTVPEHHLDENRISYLVATHRFSRVD
jgi:hypothetical protein